MWWKKYESLELSGGNISYICDDLEDMIEISYPDGMFIDIGKINNVSALPYWHPMMSSAGLHH